MINIYLVIVFLKYIQFVSTIKEILPVSYLYNLCMHHIKFITLFMLKLNNPNW